MAIKIQTTKDYGLNGVKCLVFSPAGYGKTVLASSAPGPIIISAESGLLSLQDKNIPYIEVKSVDDVFEIYEWAKRSDEAKQYYTLCLDSVTEIAEVMLSQFKGEERDPRQAYGRLADTMSGMIRAFRDLHGKNVYFSAKQVTFTDEASGVTSYKPSMPGKQLLNGLPFFFDEVFPLRLGKTEDGTVYRYLQTYADLRYDGKDRSGKLAEIEPPNLTAIFEKILTGPKVRAENEERRKTEPTSDAPLPGEEKETIEETDETEEKV